MIEFDWITEGDALAVHMDSIESFGGSPGIRDMALLQSALAKPLNQFYYEQADIFTLAASYAFGIVKNHPFIDGNKRTGFGVCVLFLETNDQVFTATETDATRAILQLAAGELSELEFADWLRSNGGA